MNKTHSMLVKHRILGHVEVLIDEDDKERFCHIRWRLFKRRNAYYVRGEIDGRPTLLHRAITDAPEDMTVDHIDGNPLNNRRSNLRICSNEENVSAAWKRGAYDEALAKSTHRNVVRKRLSDGTIKTYIYDRRLHQAR